MNVRQSLFFWIFFCCLVPQTVLASPHAEYLRGVKEFKTLLGEEDRAQFREEWFKILARFENSLKAAPKSADAPKCMYFVGRVYEELGRRSFLSEDRSRAFTSFEKMIAAYPEHGWTDDSLYREGLIWLEQVGDKGQARSIFEQVVSRYPRGDMAVEARRHLADLPAGAVKKSAAAQKKAQGPVVTLTGIRHWSSPKYTRVVLDMDQDVRYSKKLLGPHDGHQNQLCIELEGTVVGKDVLLARTIGDGILAHVLVATPGKRTTQVLIDLERMDHYRIFTLPDPYRVVLDVFGPESLVCTPQKSGNDLREALNELQGKKGNKKGTTSQKRTAAQKKPSIAVSSKQKKYTCTLVEQLGLTVKTIMIDPGHGGKDPGAVSNGLREKDIVLRMAKILGKKLRQKGFTVHYTRSKDVFIPLEERTAIANAKSADLFLSLHCNSFIKDRRVRGLETYYLNLATDAQAVRVAARENGVSAKKISDMQFILSDLMLNSKIKESREMAGIIQKKTVRGMSKKYSLKNHGVKGAFFYVLTGARMPSVLIEMGYLTNKQEAQRLNSNAYLNALAEGIVDGVVSYREKLERYAVSGK